MHDILCEQLGLCEDKSNRNFSIEATGATSATPGSNTKAIIVDCVKQQDFVSFSVADSSRER